MNSILKRILIGALAVSVPVGGGIFYFATRDSDKEDNNEIVEKKDEEKIDKGEEKKDDNQDHPKTDVVLNSDHLKKINLLKDNYNNDEIVGVVNIPNVLESIVVKHKDNEYYLNHGLDNKENLEGSVFLDYRNDINSGRKNIIYGHNGNSEVLNIQFDKLENYYNKEFLVENPIIYLEDDKGVGTYQIFSVFVETRDDNYLYLNFKSDSSWFEHISYLKNKSMYNTDVNVDATDDVLILQTCSHNEEYSKYKDKYLVVVAKRINYEY